MAQKRKLRTHFIIYIQPWSSVVLPIITKAFAPISASEFVSVQPMSQPSGKVFYLDFVNGNLVIIFDEELWWEEDEKGNLYCPQIENDQFIADVYWNQARDDYLIIPKWEIEQQEQYIGGIGNKQIKYGKVYLDDIPWFQPAGLNSGKAITPLNFPSTNKIL